jgi:hypothetical protein
MWSLGVREDCLDPPRCDVLVIFIFFPENYNRSYSIVSGETNKKINI